MSVHVSSEPTETSSRTRATDGEHQPFTDVARLLDQAQSTLALAGRDNARIRTELTTLISHDETELPDPLARVVDRPRSGQGVFFPVLGARRAIGLIYADNGRRPSTIQDVEIVELATAQVGLAFENELLRRQVDRAAHEAS